MTAQVKFFPPKYVPSEEERQRLQRRQDHWTFVRAKMETQIREQKMTQWQELIYRERSHNKVRETWELIPGHGPQENVAAE